MVSCSSAINCHRRSFAITEYLHIEKTIINNNNKEDSVMRGDITMAVPIPGQDYDDVDLIIFDVVNVGYFASSGYEVN